MKKNMAVAYSVFFLLLIIILGTACGTTNDEINQTNPNTMSDTSSTESAITYSEEQRILYKIVIQRGKERFSFEEKDSNYCTLVSDVENLLIIAPRGGAGIDSSTLEKNVDVKDIDIIRESEKDSGNKVAVVENEGVWIRLYYKPYRPGQGMNDFKHKDVMVYIDLNDTTNAYLARQNPDDLSKWDLILLPGYGPWLQKEIDMLLRLKTAF